MIKPQTNKHEPPFLYNRIYRELLLYNLDGNVNESLVITIITKQRYTTLVGYLYLYALIHIFQLSHLLDPISGKLPIRIVYWAKIEFYFNSRNFQSGIIGNLKYRLYMRLKVGLS